MGQMVPISVADAGMLVILVLSWAKLALEAPLIQLQSHDGVALKVSLLIPNNVTHFSFSYKFYTTEFPNYVCSKYNDIGVAMMNPSPLGHTYDNIIFDSQNNPLSVNNAYLECCTPTPLHPDFICPYGPSELVGTGFENEGGTRWHKTSVPIQPGTTIEIIFAIWDSSDGSYDSTMLIDNWRWLTN